MTNMDYRIQERLQHSVNDYIEESIRNHTVELVMTNGEKSTVVLYGDLISLHYAIGEFDNIAGYNILSPLSEYSRNELYNKKQHINKVVTAEV